MDEYLKGRKAFTDGDVVRDPKVARDARRAFSLDMESKFRNQLRLEGRPPSEAAALAKKMTSEKMATLAALHNPDLFAGGKDIIGDFGDRRINSSIGSQWPSRISGLDTAASNIPDINRETTKVNAKLKKC